MKTILLLLTIRGVNNYNCTKHNKIAVRCNELLNISYYRNNENLPQITKPTCTLQNKVEKAGSNRGKQSVWQKVTLGVFKINIRSVKN